MIATTGVATAVLIADASFARSRVPGARPILTSAGMSLSRFSETGTDAAFFLTNTSEVLSRESCSFLLSVGGGGVTALWATGGVVAPRYGSGCHGWSISKGRIEPRLEPGEGFGCLLTVRAI